MVTCFGDAAITIFGDIRYLPFAPKCWRYALFQTARPTHFFTSCTVAVFSMYSHRISTSKLLLPLAFFFLLLAVFLLLAAYRADAGTWTALANSPPVGVNNCLLLSDGTVLGMNGAGQCVRLAPDIHGSYINGTWTQLATMNSSRLFFSSDVLTNGNVFVAGGEYGDANHYDAELYDSRANTWTVIPGSQSPNFNYSDSPSQMLPNGNVLESDSQSTYQFYNVASNMMVHGGPCGDMNEVCWVKLANGAIFGVNDYGTAAEHFVSSINAWVVDASSTPSGFQDGDDANYLLPNGQVFHVGSTTNTGFYTPGASATSAGTLVNGPNLPIVGTNQLVAGESPGALLVNGNVLLELAPNGGGANGGAPAYFYEYNYLSNTFTSTTAPGGGLTYGTSPFVTSMLVLPDGSVLFVGGQNSGSLYIYTPVAVPLAAGQPIINSITENLDGSYHLTGTNLNGISEGAIFGDDEQMACNYPLVRLTNNTSGNVYYARTHDWSATTVQNINQVTTEFSLPPNFPPGTYSLVVTAVGNASAPQTFTYTPGAAPTGLTGTVGNAQAVLSWNPVPGATSYNLKRLTTVGTPYYATVATITGTNYTDLGLVNEFTYSYAVSAVSGGGESTNSPTLMLTPSGQPPVPTGVTAVQDTFARIDLAWTASYGAASYHIKRSSIHNGPYTNLANSVNPFYTDSGLTSGATYYYVISAVSALGESGNSVEVSATAQAIVNFGFEVPSIGSGNYQYVPSGAFWTFSGTNGNGSGLIANGSGFSNPNAPEGVQAAFVQVNGSISQVLSGFAPGTNYTITYSAAQRPGGNQHGGESWNVTIDGSVIRSNNAPGSTSYATYTASFTASAATHTLAFVGTDLVGGDNTVFLDNIRISPTLQPVAPAVTLTAPTNNATIIEPPTITLAANVVSNGNIISGVQFYDDTTNVIGQVSSPPYTLGWSPNTGNYSVFARATYNGGSVADSPAALITVINTNVNFGFETPSIGLGNFQYDPSGASWTFSGSSGNGSGLLSNGSGFGNPNAPQGVQAAFVQSFGSISQILHGFTPGVTYTITYSAAQRSGANQHGGESWNVLIDNTVITNNNPGGTSYATYTATFPASAFTHTLSFVGTDMAGGDNTVFIDNVRINPPISQVPPSVALTSPADNAVFSAANPINLAATVTTNGNNVVGLQFYSDTTNLITQVTAPYTYAWSNANAGASTVFARLIFNGTNTVDSSPVNITVTNPPPLTQAIGLGADGQTLSVSGLGLASRPYYLNAATNLTPPVVWAQIQTNISDMSGNISFTNIAPTNAQQFFIISAP